MAYMKKKIYKFTNKHVNYINLYILIYSLMSHMFSFFKQIVSSKIFSEFLQLFALDHLC